MVNAIAKDKFMLTIQQVDKYFNAAQVILFLGIVGIFVGYLINSPILMNISFGLELLVGLLFLVPLLTSIVKSNIELVVAISQGIKNFENDLKNKG
jgi:multisubunit Na+/H+ antiporter MnhE subunit